MLCGRFTKMYIFQSYSFCDYYDPIYILEKSGNFVEAEI